MLVKLARNFFTKSGELFYARNNPNEIGEEHRDALPPDAEVLETAKPSKAEVDAAKAKAEAEAAAAAKAKDDANKAAAEKAAADKASAAAAKSNKTDL